MRWTRRGGRILARVRESGGTAAFEVNVDVEEACFSREYTVKAW